MKSALGKDIKKFFLSDSVIYKFAYHAQKKKIPKGPYTVSASKFSLFIIFYSLPRIIPIILIFRRWPITTVRNHLEKNFKLVKLQIHKITSMTNNDQTWGLSRNTTVQSCVVTWTRARNLSSKATFPLWCKCSKEPVTSLTRISHDRKFPVFSLVVTKEIDHYFLF